VTNIEYARFVEATGYRVPEYWVEGTYPTEKATHPVTGITPKDANAYCKWLSQETGKSYRLPAEWEWEWAATGPQGERYPWGDQFDKDRCNTKEAAIGETTPVGSYLAGINQYGMTDMSGNVWEITQGYISSSSSSLLLSSSSLLSSLLSLSLLYIVGGAGGAGGAGAGAGAGERVLNVLRGGAFNTSSDWATCFFRREYSTVIKEIGFRCVRDS